MGSELHWWLGKGLKKNQSSIGRLVFITPPPPCFSRPIVGTGSGVCVTGGEGDSLTPLQLDGFFACLHSEKILELLVSLSYLDQTLHPWLS